MGGKSDRRESARMPFSAEVSCLVNGDVLQGTIRDLSLTGMYISTTACPRAASKCEIEIIINGDNSRLRIDKLKGTVARSGEGGVGIQFDNRLEWIALVPIYFHKVQAQLTA